MFNHNEHGHSIYGRLRGSWSILTPLCKFCTNPYWPKFMFRRWPNKTISIPCDHGRGVQLCENGCSKSKEIKNFMIRGMVSPVRQVATHSPRTYRDTWHRFTQVLKIHLGRHNCFPLASIGVFVHGEYDHATHGHPGGPWLVLTPLCKFCIDPYWANFKYKIWLNKVISTPWDHMRGVP